MTHNQRCKTCNKVSSREIETNAYDHHEGNFVVDPVDPNAFICEECKQWHETLSFDFTQKFDDVWGWNTVEEILEDMDDDMSADLPQPVNDNKEE